MTKEAYYEMCESLNSLPIEEEIPVEFEDLFIEVQQALSIYSSLRDDWDYINGTYIGKQLVGIRDIFTIHEVPASEQKVLLNIINLLDKARIKLAAANKPKEKSPL